MQIIGHRGAAGLAPENTIEAIEKGIASGADWLEFDVRRTVDGHIVLVHDRTTGRVGLQRLSVKRTTNKELQAIPMRQGQRIPTLEEALRIINDRVKVMIEIKSPECTEQVIQQIQSLRKEGLGTDRILITSFSPAILRTAQKLDKTIPLGLLQVWPVRFRWLQSIKLSAVGFYHIGLTSFAIRLAKKRGLLAYAYTVNSPTEAQRLKQAGIDAIVTDHPERFTVKSEKQPSAI